MMRKLALALSALSVLAFASSAAAQGGKVGIGVGIGADDLISTTGFDPPTVEVYVPIAIAPNLRVEPSLGILTADDNTTDVTTRDLTIGVGVFLLQKAAQTADLYVGGRLKLNFANVDTPAGDDSSTDFLLAAAIGGEYYVATRFSLGVEAQLGYYNLGDVSGVSSDTSGFFTNGVLFARFYL